MSSQLNEFSQCQQIHIKLSRSWNNPQLPTTEALLIASCDHCSERNYPDSHYHRWILSTFWSLYNGIMQWSLWYLASLPVVCLWYLSLLVHEAILHIFSLLSSIPFYEYMLCFIYPFYCQWIFECNFWLL